MYLLHEGLQRTDEEELIVKIYTSLTRRTQKFIRKLRREFELVIGSDILPETSTKNLLEILNRPEMEVEPEKVDLLTENAQNIAVETPPKLDYLPELLSKPDSFNQDCAGMQPIDSTAANAIERSVFQLDRLGNDQWLDDEIINIYLKHVLVPTSKVEGIGCVSSFFFQKLYLDNKNGSKHEYKYNAGEPYWRCAADARIILVPMFYCNHWTLLVMDKNKNEMYYHDSLGLSLGREGIEYLTILRQFVASYDNKHSKPLVESNKNWVMFGSRHHHVYDRKRKTYTPPFPQRNQTDCGVFLIRYAMCYAFGHSINEVRTDCFEARAKIKRDLIGLYVLYRKSVIECTTSNSPESAEVAEILMELVRIVEKRGRVKESLERTPTKKRRFGDYDLPDSGPFKLSKTTKDFSRVLRNRVVFGDDSDDDALDDVPLTKLVGSQPKLLGSAALVKKNSDVAEGSC